MTKNVFLSSLKIPLAICPILSAATILLSCSDNPAVTGDTAQTEKILLVADDLLNSGHIKRALHYIDSSYTEFKTAGPVDKWRRHRFLTNYYLNYVIQLDKAGLHADSMFYMLNGVEKVTKAEYAESMFARADVLRAKKKYNDAFRHYFLGREFAIKNLDKCELSAFTNRLGLIRYVQQDYLNAVSYFKKALSENARCDTSVSFETRFIIPQSVYNSIALSYEKAAYADSAIYYYTKGIQFIQNQAGSFPDRKMYIETALGVFYGNLGGQLGAIGQYNTAEEHLKKSIALNDREGYAEEDASTAKIKLSQVYLKTNRLSEAKVLIDRLDADIAKRESINSYNQQIRLNMIALKAKYFESTNDFEQAFTYLSEKERLKDSILKVDRSMMDSNVDVGFKQAAQALKLDIAKKNNQIKTFFLVAVVIISIMAVSILVIVWFNLKRSKKNVKQLSLLNKQIRNKNKQLSQTLGMLQQSQEENERLLRVVAHDLRDPIGAVKMIASLLLQESERHVLKDVKLFEMVKKSSSVALDLVTSILRPKQDEYNFKKQQEDIYQILHFCVDQLNLKAAEKGQRIELNGSQIFVEVNAEQIWRVVSNLIGNAIKFSRADSKIIVTLVKRGEKTVISIADSGIGIPEELKDKIFDHTEEVHRRGTAGEETHGLGLAISKQIVEAHGGRIWFTSDSSTGTIFYVELP